MLTRSIMKYPMTHVNVRSIGNMNSNTFVTGVGVQDGTREQGNHLEQSTGSFVCKQMEQKLI